VKQQEAAGRFGGQGCHLRGFGLGGALPVVSGQRASGILETPGGGREFGGAVFVGGGSRTPARPYSSQRGRRRGPAWKRRYGARLRWRRARWPRGQARKEEGEQESGHGCLDAESARFRRCGCVSCGGADGAACPRPSEARRVPLRGTLAGAGGTACPPAPKRRGISCTSCAAARAGSFAADFSGRPPPVWGRWNRPPPPNCSCASSFSFLRWMLRVKSSIVFLAARALLFAGVRARRLFFLLLFFLGRERQHRTGVGAHLEESRGSGRTRPRCGPSWR